MDLVRAVKERRAKVEWAELVSEHAGHKLTLKVFRDALKVDGIRYPASARVMQQIADMTATMLLTPKVLDLIWIEAGKSGLRFDPVINHKLPGKSQPTIVADLTPEIVSPLVDEKIENTLGNAEGHIASVGKYWVLSNRLAYPGAYGTATACNYGWHSSSGLYQAVTPGLKVWQSQGTRHNDLHVDPSQVVKLMDRSAVLRRAGSSTDETVDLAVIAKDPVLSALINHDGPLKYVRQMSVAEPRAVKNADGSYTLPEVILL
jgi:hypothetical protein